VGVKASKEKFDIVVITNSMRMTGKMHVIPGGRLTDEINKERDFLPLTDVTIYDVSGENAISSLDFIAINKNLILLIAPISPGVIAIDEEISIEQ